MTIRLRRLALNALDALALMLGFAPALLMLCAAAGVYWRALLPLGSVLACVPLSLLPGRKRLVPLILLALLGGAAGWLLSPLAGMWRVGYALLSLALPLIALPLLGAQGMTLAQIALLVLQLAASLLTRGAELSALRPIIGYLGCAQVVMFLFYLNMAQLRYQCASDGSFGRLAPANLGLTALLAALTLAVANAGAIWSAIKRAAKALLRWLISLLGTRGTEDVPAPIAGDGGGMMAMPATEEPSLFWTIMEYVAVALTAALAAYLLYRVAKRLPALARKAAEAIRRLLGRYRDAVSADYTDETQALDKADMRTAREGAFARLRTRLKRAPDWRSLDNRQRVREAYRRLSARSRADHTLTAREALTEPLGAPELADAYDRARYSAHDVTDAEAEAAREAVKKR